MLVSTTEPGRVPMKPRLAITDRASDDLVDPLDQPHAADAGEHHRAGQGADEAEAQEDGAVDALPDDGGTDGPGPEEPPAGGQLELGEDEAVEELAAQVGGQGGHDQTGGTAEDAGEGGLAV